MASMVQYVPMLPTLRYTIPEVFPKEHSFTTETHDGTTRQDQRHQTRVTSFPTIWCCFTQIYFTCMRENRKVRVVENETFAISG
jgi:hypothetical protein